MGRQWGDNKSVSAFKASAAAFAAWEAQSEGGKRGALHCTVVQSKDHCSSESKSRDRIASATPPTRQQQCTKGQSQCCCPRPPFNLGLRAAHIRGEPCNPPPSHLLAVSSLAHNFPPAVPLSQILLISTLHHPTHLAHASKQYSCPV